MSTAQSGFRLEIGVTRDPRDPLAVTVTVLPDLEATPIALDSDQAQEAVHELISARREVSERSRGPDR